MEARERGDWGRPRVGWKVRTPYHLCGVVCDEAERGLSSRGESSPLHLPRTEQGSMDGTCTWE